MEIHYYTLPKSSELGKAVCRLLDEVNECDRQSEKLAAGLGAISYLTADEDFGGINAFEFAPDRILPKKLWEELPGENDGHTYYVPAVEVSRRIMKSGEAEKYLDKPDCMVGSEVEYGRARMAIAGKEADGSGGGNTFRMVTFVRGARKAVRTYMRMMALPVIPKGAVNALLGVKCGTARCGLMDCGEFIYITSPVPVDSPFVEAGSEEDFHKHIAIRKALHAEAKHPAN